MFLNAPPKITPRILVEIGFPWNQRSSAAEKPEAFIRIDTDTTLCCVELYLTRSFNHNITESDHN